MPHVPLRASARCCRSLQVRTPGTARFGWLATCLKPLNCCCLLTTLFGAHAALRAQVGMRIEAVATGRDVWHGVTRSPGVSVVPAVAGGYSNNAFSVSVGAAYQYDRHSSGDQGPFHGLAARNFWVQATATDGEARFLAGFQRHVLADQQVREAVGPLANATELYAGLSAPNSHFDPQVEVWYNAAAAHGFYLRLAGNMPLLAWPVRPMIVGSFDAEIGVNLGQDLLGASRRAIVGSHDRGVTHGAVGLTLSMNDSPEQLNVAAGIKTQLNLSDAARYSDATHTRGMLLWVWIGVSYAVNLAGGRQP